MGTRSNKSSKHKRGIPVFFRSHSGYDVEFDTIRNVKYPQNHGFGGWMKRADIVLIVVILAASILGFLDCAKCLIRTF
jgi:hypothetical protein